MAARASASEPAPAALRLAPFLFLTLALPAAVVAGNFVLALLTPTTIWIQDEFTFFDAAWRVVQGQRLGIDFQHILGFGISELAAALWRWLGPHYFVLRASADLYALAIVACAGVVAVRQLRSLAGLATLFCLTVAFVASAPLVFGTAREFGLAGYFNRLITAALMVLFVQNFATAGGPWRRDYVFLATAALLLNILFLVKISGLIVGLLIVAGGSISRGDITRRLGDLALILLLTAALVAIDFAITGSDFKAVFDSYRSAIQGRSEGAASRPSLNILPVVAVVALLFFYALSRARERKNALFHCTMVIAFFGACQILLNLSNNILDEWLVLDLAAPAAVAVVTWMQPPHEAPFWNRPWAHGTLERLERVSVMQAVPLLVIAIVLLPLVSSDFLAGKVAASVSMGRARTLTLTAGKGIAFELLAGSDPAELDLALSVNQAVKTIEKLGAGGEPIATLDFVNPFPVLLLAPSPKGVGTSWAFSERPLSYTPTWQQIIGDACLVAEPKRPLLGADNFQRLDKAIRPHLTEAFTLAHEDGSWRFWKRRDGCERPVDRQSNAAPRSETLDTAQATVPQCGGVAQSILGMRRSELGRPVSTERMNRWLDFLQLQFAEATKRCS